MHYSLITRTSQETLMHYSLMDFTRLTLFIDGSQALFIDGLSQETLMHYSLMDITRNFNALFIDGLHKKL